MTLLSVILLLIATETESCRCAGDEYCYCIGDGGASHGCLQQGRLYVQDVNDYFGTDYQWPEDCYHRETAIEITTLYMKRWVTPEKLGRTVLVRDVVRTHNGGWDGWREPETLPHWNKFKRKLRE